MWNIVFLIAIVFVLTYNPKSRTLEKFVGQPTAPTQKSCEDAHYQSVQFAQSPYDCPAPGRTQMGAIV
jgi:hypothetical protein